MLNTAAWLQSQTFIAVNQFSDLKGKNFFQSQSKPNKEEGRLNLREFKGLHGANPTSSSAGKAGCDSHALLALWQASGNAW